MSECEWFVGQGTTSTYVFQWGDSTLTYKPIAAKVAPTPLTLTVTAHGLPLNTTWSVALTDTGLTDLDAEDWPPQRRDWKQATVIDADTLAFNTIDATRLDGTYTPGGSVVYKAPVDLAGATGTFTLYAAPAANPPVPALTVAAVFDNTVKSITVTLDAASTTNLVPGPYTFALEVTDSSGAVWLLKCGDLVVFVPGTDCECQ